MKTKLTIVIPPPHEIYVGRQFCFRDYAKSPVRAAPPETVVRELR